MNGEVTCCLMLSMILVDLIAAWQLGGWLVGKRYRVGRCRWYWKVHSSSSSSFFTPIQAPTKCSFGCQHKDTKKFGSRRVIQSFSPKLAILVYWDKWWHTLSEALVHSQGSWLAPRGLFWLPGVLVDPQRLWLTPRGLGWLPGALVDSQRPALAPRGLGSLPEVLVGSQGPWLAPRGLGRFPGVLLGSQKLWRCHTLWEPDGNFFISTPSTWFSSHHHPLFIALT